MKVNKEIRNLFKDHKAHFKDLGDIQILDWNKDDTICQSIRYVFDRNMLYISGDYGCATFQFSCTPIIENVKRLDLDCFFGKCKSFGGSANIFDSKQAKKDIRYHMDNLFEEYHYVREEKQKEIEKYKQEINKLNTTDKDYENKLTILNHKISLLKQQIVEAYKNENIKEKGEIQYDLCELADSVSVVEEWAWELNQQSKLIDKLEEYDLDYWEWIYDVGKAIPFEFELYLAGLELASEYLENKSR